MFGVQSIILFPNMTVDNPRTSFYNKNIKVFIQKSPQ
nr:MAG TPA: hypothetical protein [Caudoviricetes sp.]